MPRVRASVSPVARRRPAVVVVVLVAALLALTGCTGGSEATTDHNATDLTFVESMVPHHEQALELVALTEGRDLDPAFTTLAQEIDTVQRRELVQLREWQQAWAGDDDPEDRELNMGGTMAGMMTDEQLDGLAAADDGSFRRLWLQSMIEHHQGALGMARDEVDAGRSADAVALATSIIETQQAEIVTMQALLAG